MLPILLKKAPSRLFWLLIAATLECIGFLLIFFSLNLLLPMDVTNSAEEAASWASMIQSVGYVIGAMGPFILGWIFDASSRFTSAIIGMLVIVLCMIVIQLITLGKKARVIKVNS